MKHISIRVPWHDNKWNGTICQCPKNNPFCMMLHNISERKDENKVGVKVEVAEGEKCERCWKYSTEVGENHEHPTLCHRCAEAIS